jgi:hypothetical protein
MQSYSPDLGEQSEPFCSLQEEHTEVNTPGPTIAQALERISELQRQLDAIRPQVIRENPIAPFYHRIPETSNLRRFHVSGILW